ncbi:hypothetical protein [Glaciihabitans sp. UYNi722]|uniref:hypothetical protein n=1 Tax=Glaciihabitans sp. UYNi722 TaxID=3156344 RepID=UPI003399F1E1
MTTELTTSTDTANPFLRRLWIVDIVLAGFGLFVAIVLILFTRNPAGILVGLWFEAGAAILAVAILFFRAWAWERRRY